MSSALDHDDGTRPSHLPPGRFDDDDDEASPELITDQTLEMLLRGAKGLVIVVNVVVMITFGILALGFLLHLAGASPEATFVDWVYRNTDRAMQPFRGMFPIRAIDDRSVFDASLLFAAAVYGFVAISLHAVVVYLSAKVRRYHHRAVMAELAARAQSEKRSSSGPLPERDERPRGLETTDRSGP